MQLQNLPMKKVGVFYSIIFACFFGFGQNSSYLNALRAYYPTYPESPSTAEFARYGSINNSEYTGANSPVINLFSISEGGINIPINLVYTSGNGIKVNQEASLVGLGWSLPLPTITQTVMGFDDFDAKRKKIKFDFYHSVTPYMRDFPVCYDGQNQTGFGTSFNPKCNAPTGFNASPSFDTFGFVNAYDCAFPMNGVFNTYPFAGSGTVPLLDGEPDIFVVNLFGEKIEFIMNNFPNSEGHGFEVTPLLYGFRVLNNSGYRIYYFNDQFTITDANGTSYVFSDIEKVKTYDYSIVKHRNFLLSKIITYNGKTVCFSYFNWQDVYNRFNESEHTYYTLNNNATDGDGFLENCPMGNFDEKTNERFDGVPFRYYRYKKVNGTIQNYKSIAEISGDFGKLVFDYSANSGYFSQKIDTIKLYDYNNQLISTQLFQYDYFDTFQDTPERLKLVSVLKNGFESHVFSYNSTPFSKKGSFAMDYWGYSNGGYNNVSYCLNPTDFNGGVIKTYIPLNKDFTNNFKKSSFEHLKAGILEKITYPTKGYSVFEYEENESNNLFVDADFSSLTKGNGLRLKSQKNYDKNQQFINGVEFEYFLGKSMRPLALAHRMIYRYEDRKYNTDGSLSGDLYVKTGDYIQLSSHNVMGFSPLSDGDYVGYSKVIKKQINSIGNSNGKIETIYTNELGHYVTPNNNIPLLQIPAVKGNKDENGLVLNQKVFDASNELKTETNNQYLTKQSNFTYGVIIKHGVQYRNWYESVWGAGTKKLSITTSDVTQLGYYPIYSSNSKLLSSKTTNYLPSGNSISETYYKYDSQYQKECEITLGKDAKSYSKKYLYPYSGGYIGKSKLEPHFLNKNRISEVVQTEEYVGSKLVNQVWKNYKTQGDIAVPETVFSQRGNVSTADVRKVHFNRYDDKANILQITEDNGMSRVILYGYNKTLTIAKIENATYEEVNAQLASSGLTIETINETHLGIINNLRSQLPQAMITTYTHKPLIGVATITDPRGRTVTYIYDQNNRLKEIRDHEGKLISEHQYNYKN